MNAAPATAEFFPSILLVDDDATFRAVLVRAMQRRGYFVIEAESAEQGLVLAQRDPPEYAVVDLKMGGASGLTLVRCLKELDAQTRILVLTGYGSIATAVEAIKLGAMHYMTKPADADEILAAFKRTDGDPDVPVKPQPLSVERLEWEHIQKVLQEHSGNISSTARSLQMHRRTLQRKLAKYPVRN